MEENTTQNSNNAQLQAAFNAGYAKGMQNNIIELLKNEQFSSFANSVINSFATTHKDNIITTSKRYLREYLFDIIMVGVILIGIIYSAINGYIEHCTTGTLIGTVIGYALSRLKSEK